MTYISADGTVGGKKSPWKFVTDFFGGIFSLLALFFTTVTNPQAIESNRRSSSSRTFAQRNQGRSYRPSGGGGGGQTLGRGNARPKKGSNVRGITQLGDANCQVASG